MKKVYRICYCTTSQLGNVLPPALKSIFFDRSVQIKKVKIHSNTAYGVVPPRKDEPMYDVIGLPLSRNAASESTEM